MLTDVTPVGNWKSNVTDALSKGALPAVPLPPV
jgi:hypothetical protein